MIRVIIRIWKHLVRSCVWGGHYVQSGSWVSVDFMCSLNLRFLSTIKSRGTWCCLHPRIPVKRRREKQKMCQFKRGRIQGGESKEKEKKGRREVTTIWQHEVFIYAWQCCSDTQLSIWDPNRRQKEKKDVLKQRSWQVKLKESVRSCDFCEEKEPGWSWSPPELCRIPGMTRGVHQDDMARCWDP